MTALKTTAQRVPKAIAAIRVRPASRTPTLFRRRPWAGRVQKLPGGLFRVTLADGSTAGTCWPTELIRRHPHLPPEGVAWAEAAVRNFRRDPKADELDELVRTVYALRQQAQTFLADHHPPCRCGVCDLLAALDALDPAGRPGSMAVGHIRGLYALLGRVGDDLRAYTAHRQDGGDE